MTRSDPALSMSAEHSLKVDTHVHLHSDFDLGEALDMAAANMELTFSTGQGALLLTEMPGVQRFAEFIGEFGPWTILPTGEEVSVLARHKNGMTLAIIAGHQLVSEEGIEVLMLGQTSPLPSGLPLHETIESVCNTGALAVLPWGFGKWTFARGQMISDLTANAPSRAGVYLADTGIRANSSARPSLLANAEQKGWRVLAGTDPLPFAGQVAAVGRFGIQLPASLVTRTPFAGITEQLAALDHSPATFGRLPSGLSFFSQQLRMQLRKRFS